MSFQPPNQQCYSTKGIAGNIYTFTVSKMCPVLAVFQLLVQVEGFWIDVAFAFF